MKRYLPQGLKQFLWFVFKSPQRKHGGSLTLLTDFIGYFSILFNKKRLKPITICTGLKNRSNNYINILLESLNKCDHKDLIHLSIYDCGSNDVSNLLSSIQEKWKGEVTYETENIDFSRSYTFNKALKQSKTELLFACDADMELPSNLIELINKYVSNKSAWFPIPFHLDKNGKDGNYKMEGKGIFATTKEQLMKTGFYNEEFTSWGDEDWELFFRFYKNKIRPHRTWERKLIHHYHESARPVDYKSIYQ